jgi:DNA polymerase-3 subunit alpha
MAFVTLEDFTGKCECIVFSDAFSKYENILVQDAMVMVTGKGELNGDALKILVNEVVPMERVREKFTKSVILSMNLRDLKEDTIIKLKHLMEQHEGNCSCYLTVMEADTVRRFHTRKFNVEPSDAFLGEAKKLLGDQSVRFTSN